MHYLSDPKWVRSEVVYRRTYSRPIDEGNNVYETWRQTVDRVIHHQFWLWDRASPGKVDLHELEELRALLLSRHGALAGRTLWLGGTEVAMRREASQFNCAHTVCETANDVVDIYWLLLQGCGVGFKPETGTLSGFTKPAKEIEVIRSERTAAGGREHNVESWDPDTRTWTVSVGDSAEAWAKAAGKIVAMKYPADRVVIDLSQIRPAGTRLRGYGWISSGDELIAVAFAAICRIFSRYAGRLLPALAILDVANWLGTTLSSRRSAEICLLDHGHPEWQAFAGAKRDYWLTGNEQRAMSNNSLLFWSHPGRRQIAEIFDMMVAAGGSEPGLINGAQARERAPWFKGFNPCAEIALPNKGFCNLCEIDLAAFADDYAGMERAIYLLARANYRQTLVDLEDGTLSPAWHQNNQFLHLCGVGLTGIVRRPDMGPHDFRSLRRQAHRGALNMAAEVGAPLPKNITTIKPSGTMSKLMATTEGIHRPLGGYIFNNINFSRHDPLVGRLTSAGYRAFANPTDKEGVVITFPVSWPEVDFDHVNGKAVNLEPAVAQLERYRRMMDDYVDHNASITVSYSPEEVSEIVDWVDRHWDNYVAVSFLPRVDPTRSAQDLGYPYLPQQVVTEAEFKEYAEQLQPIDLGGEVRDVSDLEGGECADGVCPVR